MNDFQPTKTNLERAKRFLRFARTSHALLERKRKVLIQELLERLEQARMHAADLDANMDKAYRMMIASNISYGTLRVEEITETFPEMEGVEELSTSVMGVALPKLISEDYSIEPSFGMFRQGVAIDRMLDLMPELRRELFRFVEEENAISRLTYEIRRTAKRVNSIEKIQIPRYEQIVHDISQALEEKEREDLFRLKIVKKKLNA